MAATGWIAGLWLAFAATHVGMSSLRLRPRLVAALGPRGFQAVYSVVALVVFTALVWVYVAHRHAGPLLWAPSIGRAGLWAIYLGQGVAWCLIVAGALQPSPVVGQAFGASRPDAMEVRGAHRLSRHPMFMGVALFGLLHLPVNGFASDVAFWAGFPVFAAVGCWHQDRRKLATEGAPYRTWYDATPFLPFTGRETLRGLRELPVAAVPVGIALAVGLRLLHGPLFH